MGLAIAIIGLILFAGAFTYQQLLSKKICKDRTIKVLGKKNWIILGSLALVSGLGILLAFVGAFIKHPSWTDGRVGHEVMVALGGFFLGLGVSSLFTAFNYRYRASAIEKRTIKYFSIICLAAILPILGGIIVAGEGFAPYLTYPLPAGITFKDGALQLYRIGESTGSFRLTFYGLIIVSGVVVVYCICDRQFYLKYGKHNILDNVALTAFPAGIIGARIWYVVGNWERMFKGRPFTEVFAIWDGGLTILGGAALGIVVGLLFVKTRRKYVSISFTMDVCIPSILLAQAIGRWGNFFNCEVYGQAAQISSWSFLPTWIVNQMTVSNSGAIVLPEGQMYVPLFLIEGIVNVIGYFVLRYALGEGLKKWRKGGELGAAYFIWYGITRIIMEPLRDGEFNMGSDGAWSVVNSLMYILIGLAIIVIIQLNAYRKKDNHKDFIAPIIGASLAILGTALLAAPSLSVGRVINANNVEYIKSISGFSLIFGGKDAIHLVAWILMLLGGLTSVVSIFYRKNKIILPSVSAVLTLVASILFLGGAKWVDPMPESSITYNYSNSYGFAIYAIVGLFIAVLSLTSILPDIKSALKARKEAKND